MTNTHSYSERRPGTYQAQHAEDRWLERYFRYKRNGFYVEVGAYDGVVLSNSYHFEQIGWRGVLVEPDLEKANLCTISRPGSQIFQCAAVADPTVREVQFHSVPDGPVYSTSCLSPDHEARVRKYGLAFKTVVVPARTLDSILVEAAPGEIDFVTIDAEESELSVLQGFDLRKWRPRLVMIEENHSRRRADVRQLMITNGYRFHTAIDINHVYVPARWSARFEDPVRYLVNRQRRLCARALSWLARRMRSVS